MLETSDFRELDLIDEERCCFVVAPYLLEFVKLWLFISLVIALLLFGDMSGFGLFIVSTLRRPSSSSIFFFVFFLFTYPYLVFRFIVMV